MSKTSPTTPEEKKQFLIESLNRFDSLIVAFSGGVDSTFLLAVAKQVLDDRIVAVTAASPVHPERETSSAVQIAKDMGVEHIVLRPGEMNLPDFTANTKDRCYICKKHLLNTIFKIAREKGIKHVVHGANADDNLDYRPGARAADEAGVRAPLDEAGLTKDEIRGLSKEMGLSTWNKPAMACLASRIPYGTVITRKDLEMVDLAETVILGFGFKSCRVRHHGSVARIEVNPEEIEKIMDKPIRDAVSREFRKIGFSHIAVDIEGYIQGSLNRNIRDLPGKNIERTSMNSDHHKTSDGLTFREKLIKILAHWEAHNADHAKTYKMWAERAKAETFTKAGCLLEEAAEMSLLVNQKFQEAIELIKNKHTVD